MLAPSFLQLGKQDALPCLLIVQEQLVNPDIPSVL